MADKADEDEEDSDLDDYSDDEDDEFDKTLLENFNSCIDSNDEVDEFVIFRDTLQSKLTADQSPNVRASFHETLLPPHFPDLEASEPQFYGMITTALTPEQCKSIQEFITTANRRLAEKGNANLKLQ